MVVQCDAAFFIMNNIIMNNIIMNDIIMNKARHAIHKLHSRIVWADATHEWTDDETHS